ncbi:MAG: ribosylnicotinamide kinase [Segetibacter sp.]|nr:ribosylnicotinamide kinase [Segetibacter sp.]
MQEISKVVAIGPESTGKSTLCQSLAQHFDAVWCPEFARQYLLSHGTNYTFDDLLTIAKGQLALEEEYAIKAAAQWEANGKKTSKPLLFVDTDMYVMKVWCEYVFGKCHQFILDKIVESQCDLYLLCNVDLPWVKDELREYPDLQSREELYNIYKDILINQDVPWVDIKGNYEERVLSAIESVNSFFKPL